MASIVYIVNLRIFLASHVMPSIHVVGQQIDNRLLVKWNVKYSIIKLHKIAYIIIIYIMLSTK